VDGVTGFDDPEAQAGAGSFFDSGEGFEDAGDEGGGNAVPGIPDGNPDPGDRGWFEAVWNGDSQAIEVYVRSAHLGAGVALEKVSFAGVDEGKSPTHARYGCA
jgi:hypothetical protein